MGFQGGVCGALAGAIMGLNLLLGMDIGNASYFQTLKAFAVGHINLLVEKPIGKPEPFAAGKSVVGKFKKEAGAIECRSITQKSFSDWKDFQEYMATSEKCRGLIGLAAAEASSVISRLQ